MKKVFIISSVLLVVVLIFLAVFLFAFKQDSPTSTASTATTTQTETQNTAVIVDDALEDEVPIIVTPSEPERDEVIIPVSMRLVISPTVHKGRDVVRFYDKNSGIVVEVPIIGGVEKVFADKELPGLVYAAWSPDADRVLTKFVDAGGTRIFSFDHRTNRGVQLKTGVERVEWTANGDQILYTYFDQTARRTSFNVADPDGKNWRLLAENVPQNLRFASIPQSARVAFWPAPNPDIKTDLKVVNLLDSDPRPETIFSGHYNADFLFSPNGERLLISSTQQKGSNARMIGVANSDGGEYLNLRIPTNVSKCAWAQNSTTIYCAFPTGDRDTFWKIDVTTNQKERILNLGDVVESSTKYQAFDLFLSPTGDALFFTNAIDGKLYRVALQ